MELILSKCVTLELKIAEGDKGMETGFGVIAKIYLIC